MPIDLAAQRKMTELLSSPKGGLHFGFKRAREHQRRSSAGCEHAPFDPAEITTAHSSAHIRVLTHDFEALPADLCPCAFSMTRYRARLPRLHFQREDQMT